MVECQEPRCTREATKVWGGRKVCEDHYEQYVEAQNKLINEMHDDY